MTEEHLLQSPHCRRSTDCVMHIFYFRKAKTKDNHNTARPFNNNGHRYLSYPIQRKQEIHRIYTSLYV